MSRKRLPTEFNKTKVMLILSNTEIDQLREFAEEQKKTESERILKLGFGAYILRKIEEAQRK